MKNDKGTYLFVEFRKEPGKWESYFAPDPKGVLDYFDQSGFTWDALFPLIRKAHRLARSEPDLNTQPDHEYLQPLARKVVHHACGGREFLQEEINSAGKMR